MSTPADQRRAWYQEMAEQHGELAAGEMAQRWHEACDSARLAAHFGRLVLGETEIVPGLKSIQRAEDNITWCAICGWPLQTSVYRGCVRGNCSQRPVPNRFYAPTRAKAEYAPLLDNDPRCA